MTNLGSSVQKEIIAVTVYSLTSSTVFVEIEPNLHLDQKIKLINDISMQVYESQSEISAVYEKVHDVAFAEVDYLDCEYSAELNSDGKYDLFFKK